MWLPGAEVLGSPSLRRIFWNNPTSEKKSWKLKPMGELRSFRKAMFANSINQAIWTFSTLDHIRQKPENWEVLISVSQNFEIMASQASLIYHPRFVFLMTGCRRGSRIFERGGGGVQAQIQDFSQAPPPLGHCPCGVIRPQKIWKTPPLLDIHKRTPPPLDIVRVTSFALRKIEKHPHSWTFTKGGGVQLWAQC